MICTLIGLEQQLTDSSLVHPVLGSPPPPDPPQGLASCGLEPILTVLCESTGLPQGFNTLSKQGKKKKVGGENQLGRSELVRQITEKCLLLKLCNCGTCSKIRWQPLMKCSTRYLLWAACCWRQQFQTHPGRSCSGFESLHQLYFPFLISRGPSGSVNMMLPSSGRGR